MKISQAPTHVGYENDITNSSGIFEIVGGGQNCPNAIAGQNMYLCQIIFTVYITIVRLLQWMAQLLRKIIKKNIFHQVAMGASSRPTGRCHVTAIF